jgi:hypothetical protein
VSIPLKLPAGRLILPMRLAPLFDGGTIKRPIDGRFPEPSFHRDRRYPGVAFIGDRSCAGRRRVRRNRRSASSHGRVGGGRSADRPLGGGTAIGSGRHGDRCVTTSAAGSTAACPSRPVSSRPASPRAAKPPAGPDWVHEIKHEGYGLRVPREGEAVWLFTRRGYDWTTRYPAIAVTAARLRATSFGSG